MTRLARRAALLPLAATADALHLAGDVLTVIVWRYA